MELILQLLGFTLLAVLAASIIAALSRRFRMTIFEYERGVRFRGGRFDRVLEPGVYWRMLGSRIDRVDARPARVAITGQEVLTADGVAVKGSLVATYQVVDAQRAVLGTDDFRAAVYAELQLALRAAITELPIDQLLKQRADVPARLKALAAEKVRAFGVDLLDASVRDLTFPGELKKIFNQVVKARQEGLAALEKARGETAALRNLANAAQMIERNPTLLQLRLLQVLAQQPGNTVVMGIQPGGTPIPVRGPSAPSDLPRGEPAPET